MHMYFELVSVLLGRDYTANEAFVMPFPLLEAEGLDGIFGSFLESNSCR
jgi:hypothetical protein